MLDPAKTENSVVSRQKVRFGDDFELDFGGRKLSRGGRVLKLERIPTEVLLLLVEQAGSLVTRDQIVERIWGKGISLDTDNSINGAVRKVRQVLRDDPEQAKFVQTITGTGYRFIAPVAAADEVAAPSNLASQSSTPLADTPLVKAAPPGMRWWRAAVVLLVLFVASAAAYRWWPRPSPRSPSPGGRLMLAVLPFENLTGDPGQEYFSDGLTEEMITELGRVNPAHLGVIARTSVMFYKHNPTRLDQVGRELGVQYVLEGSVRRDAGRIRITAQLIQLKDQTHLWARNYDRQESDLLVLQQEITQEIADEIEAALGDPRVANAGARRVATPTSSNDAYDLYLKGRYFWNKRTPDGFRQASDYFQQAVTMDPNYARAYAGLADTYALMSTWRQVPQNEFMPKARAAALKALEIDETLAEAHTSLALIAETYDYDWQTAEKEFARAIQLDPGYATAHHWYAEYLSWQGRFDQALAESERARQLDPRSLIIAADHGTILYYARQYDRAIAQYRAVLEMDPTFPRASGFLVRAYVGEGKFQEALDEIDRRRNPDDLWWTWADKAFLYGRWGRAAEARHAVERFEEIAAHVQFDRTQGAVPGYIGAGRNDLAIALLQKAYAEHSNVVADLKVEPLYDPLRADPRFQELQRRLGL